MPEQIFSSSAHLFDIGAFDELVDHFARLFESDKTGVIQIRQDLFRDIEKSTTIDIE